MVKRFLSFKQRARKPIKRSREIGDQAMRERDWLSAIDAYEAYLGEQPNDVPILVQYGHALKEARRIAEALDAYSRAINIAPDDSDAFHHLNSLKQSTRAFRGENHSHAYSLDTTTTISESPFSDLTTPHVELGNLAREEGSWTVAATHYRIHLSKEPFDAPIWVQLGHMLKEAGLLEQAVFAYKVGEARESVKSDVSLHLATLLSRLKRTAEATPMWARMFQESGSVFFSPENKT